MQVHNLTRRQALKLLGVGAAAVGLGACAPAMQPAAGGASNQGAAPSSAQKQMSVATYAAPLHDWQRYFSKEWAKKHPDVDLRIDEVVYAEMPQKQLSMVATGTLWDVVYSGIKWYPFSAVKGAFMVIDDLLAKRDDVQLDDFFPAALAGAKVDGKTYGLPYEIHPGNPALVAYNQDILDSKGLPHPADDWDVNKYADLAAKATDPDNKIFGTNYLPGSYYDFESLARAYDTDIMDAERKKFQFGTDEKCRAAAQWITDLRTKLHAAPSRDESQGLEFAGGKLATQVAGSYAVKGTAKTIGDKFKFGWSLFPVGPNGTRGYTAFTSNFSAYAKTQYPDLAFDLLVTLTAKEAGIWSATVQPDGQPNARKSVWGDQKVLDTLDPIFGRVLAMMSDDKIQGPFPMPSNLRFQELQDNWANTSTDLFYGDVSYQEGLQKVQDACQKILDLPRP